MFLAGSLIVAFVLHLNGRNSLPEQYASSPFSPNNELKNSKRKFAMMSTESTNAATSTPRSVNMVRKLRVAYPGGGFDKCISLNEESLGTSISPFVDLSEFVMSQPVFRPHPHAGFSAVTYMFEDSPGSFRNRWSKGDAELIPPGSLHWTQAGVGMIHEEVPTEPGVPCHGCQMFVKLSSADELTEAEAFHLNPHEIREIKPVPGARIRLLAGSAFGQSAGIGIRNKLKYLDVHLAEGATVEIPTTEETAFIFVQQGSVTTSAGDLVDAGSAASFHADGGNAVVLTATKSGPASFLFGSGEPLNEPIYSKGSFKMCIESRLDDAVAAYKNGDMGYLEPSF